ncbi:TPR domain protein in aerotolerance operon [hydrothermal vent metagenome]|uniref:TPR domain protein in aerotolerance operon n=1 Tax=hydrothermal vent metagenome TaxID=652676 RepID=A0A1W1BA19_9ZZZZ
MFYFPLLLALFLLLFIYAYRLEFKHKSLNLIASLILLTSTTQIEAALLDFYHLADAKSSLKDQDYTNALLSYKKLSQTQEVLYNTANTQYKLGLFDKAIKNYVHSLGTDDTFNAKIYYNIANAYAKLHKLSLAKKYYKKSLKLDQDIQTQENLAQLVDILSKQKHKRSKEDNYKLPQRISINKKEPLETVNSDYIVTLNKIVLSEEEKILKTIKKQKPIIFLHKLTIHRRSNNVLQD